MTTGDLADPRSAVFLDRDGTIIVEKDFLGDPDGVELLPRAAEAIRLLNQRGYLVLVVTNQSGVARGYYDEQAVQAVNNRLRELLGREGAALDGIYFCPHYLGGTLPHYRIDCECRKPRIGLARRAMEEFAVDLRHSVMIGDRAADIEFGRNLGIKSILVTTGYGFAEKERIEDEHLPPPNLIAEDLLAAVVWLLADRSRNNVSPAV
jgi:D-glycero-D-manno-heptose 1,7-bisphosphate phosphatase